MPWNPAVENPAIGQIRWGATGRLMENFWRNIYTNVCGHLGKGEKIPNESQTGSRAISQRGEGVAWCFQESKGS